jgi:integrase/recombinase XerD
VRVVVAVYALRVELTETLAYWTVVDEEWRPVASADSFLRHLRLGADRAEGTTRTYAGDLACYLRWCRDSARDLPAGARELWMFVAMLKTTPVDRPGAGRGRARGPGRINHVLAVVREFYKHAVADGAVDASVLAALYEVGDDRHLPAELRPEGSGLALPGSAAPRPARPARCPARPGTPRRGAGAAADRGILA